MFTTIEFKKSVKWTRRDGHTSEVEISRIGPSTTTPEIEVDFYFNNVYKKIEVTWRDKGKVKCVDGMSYEEFISKWRDSVAAAPGMFFATGIMAWFDKSKYDLAFSNGSLIVMNAKKMTICGYKYEETKQIAGLFQDAINAEYGTIDLELSYRVGRETGSEEVIEERSIVKVDKFSQFLIDNVFPISDFALGEYFVLDDEGRELMLHSLAKKNNVQPDAIMIRRIRLLNTHK